MRRILSLLLVCPILTGCGLLSGESGERWTAVQAIRIAEEGTKQEFLRTKAAEFAADQGQQGQTLSITTLDSAGRPVVVSMNLAPVIKAAVGRDGDGGGGAYGVELATTVLPSGVVAESIRAVGDAARDILTTPTATAFTVGAVIGGALSETGGGGTHINGETITANDSFNRTEVHATGEGNAAEARARKENQETSEMTGEEDVDG